MSKFKTSTFLTGLFCKFRLYDNDIREVITDLYGDLIESILTETSEEKRIIVFKSLIPAIKTTINYFEQAKRANTPLDRELFQVVIQLVEHCTHIIQKVGIRDDRASSVFNGIMKQTFINDIGCDIGDCIVQYKKSPRLSEKSDIIDRLTILLADYNTVMHTSLTPTGILDLKENG